ncbi:MAG: glycosyltransferase family 4 protein [Patescibacteria group bacterium]
MKILNLTYSIDTGCGWGRLTWEVVSRLMKRGYETSILTEIGSGSPLEQSILGRSRHMFDNLFSIRRHIAAADIVHEWETNPYAITGMFAGFGLKKKHVITAAGAYSVQPLYNPKMKFIAKKVYENADRVLCISRYVKNEIDKVVENANTEVVTLGVDFDKFSGQRMVNTSEPFILSVGNLGNRKGYHVSIPAFAEVAKKIPNIKYLIAGAIDESFLKAFQKLIAEYGLENKVVFLGSLSDSELKKLYLSASLFILTSINYQHHFEGYGLVFLEAASAGLPVVGTLNNGIEDAVDNRKNGILVPQNDIQATASAMLEILTNPQIERDYSENGIEWAKANSWEKVADEYAKCYQVLSEG